MMKSEFQVRDSEISWNQVAEEPLDWIATVDEILEFNQVPLERCVPVLSMRFRSRATAW